MKRRSAQKRGEGRPSADLRRALEDDLPHLRRYARHLTRDPHDAEDLVQDTLVRALTAAHRFRPGTHPRRWLFTILRNLHIDRRRRAARRGPEAPIEFMEEVGARPGAQEDRIRLLEVAGRMRGLRPEERRALTLSVFHDLPHCVVAKREGVAEGTVKSRLARARRALSL